MRLTKTSKNLVTYFLDNPCMQPVQTTNKKGVLHMLYCLQDAVSNLGHTISHYRMASQKILGLKDVPLPKTFKRDNFPEGVMNHIESHSNFHLSFFFSLGTRKIQVHFIVEEKEEEIERKMELYKEYVEKIMIWLSIVQKYASHKCSRELHLYIYHTSMQKFLPHNRNVVLDQIHVNTAFTYTCNPVSEIVVFRKEEWFKVMMHETFHNFALDFSDMNNVEATKHIRSLFHLNDSETDVNLFESYTECWARLWNAVFCSYFLMKEGEKERDFLLHFDSFMRIEIIFAYFQMVKVLDFMGIRYKDLVNGSKKVSFKEKTNVLSYYILTLVLLSNYNDFLSWCEKNNGFIAFKKTSANLQSFCEFIEKKYKSAGMLRGTKCMEDFFLKTVYGKKINDVNKMFLLNNMRMTVAELG